METSSTDCPVDAHHDGIGKNSVRVQQHLIAFFIAQRHPKTQFKGQHLLIAFLGHDGSRKHKCWGVTPRYSICFHMRAPKHISGGADTTSTCYIQQTHGECH